MKKKTITELLNEEAKKIKDKDELKNFWSKSRKIKISEILEKTGFISKEEYLKFLNKKINTQNKKLEKSEITKITISESNILHFVSERNWIESGFNSEYDYLYNLDMIEFEEQKKEAKEYGLSWEEYKRWTLELKEGESCVLVDGKPAVMKNGEVVWSKKKYRSSYNDDDNEEDRIMRNIMNGNGDLHGL